MNFPFAPTRPSRWPQGWMVVTDFDGTFTVKDIGNELSIEVLGEAWHALYRRLRSGELDLKTYQKKVWEHFPLSESAFREASLRHAELRPGVNEFLEEAADLGLPVYIASCGVRSYIEVTLDQKLTAKARSAIREIRCNEAVFGENSIAEFLPPASSDDCPYPLDKGAWTSELAIRHPERPHILGIGNGTSDRSFWGHVTRLAATEGLEKWCLENKKDYISFSDFIDLRRSLEML